MLQQISIRFLVFVVLASFLTTCLPAQEIPDDHIGDVIHSRSRNVQKFAGFPDLYEASIAELQEGLEQKVFTSVDLVKARGFLLLHFVAHLRDLCPLGLSSEDRGSQSEWPSITSYY